MQSYTKENCLTTNLSACINIDNLTHLKHKNATLLAVHDLAKISLTSIGPGGKSSKEITFEATCEDNRSFIQRVKLVQLQDRPFLVVASSKTVKVFSVEEKPQLLFSHNMSSDHKLGQMVHSVEVLSKSMLAVASHTKVYFFTVNSSGGSFKSKEIHHDFKSNSRSLIYNFSCNGQSQCAVADNAGLITMWKFEDNKSFTKMTCIEVHPNTKCTSLQLYRNLLVVSTVSGQIQLINTINGQLQCEIQAHVRCITSFDIATKSGYLVTVSEDSRLRVFQLVHGKDDKYSVQQLHEVTLPNEIICGAKFLDCSGSQLAVSTYESCNIKMFKLTQPE